LDQFSSASKVLILLAKSFLFDPYFSIYGSETNKIQKLSQLFFSREFKKMDGTDFGRLLVEEVSQPIIMRNWSVREFESWL
jgi:hypothetical protein